MKSFMLNLSFILVLLNHAAQASDSDSTMPEVKLLTAAQPDSSDESDAPEINPLKRTRGDELVQVIHTPAFSMLSELQKRNAELVDELDRQKVAYNRMAGSFNDDANLLQLDRAKDGLRKLLAEKRQLERNNQTLTTQYQALMAQFAQLRQNAEMAIITAAGERDSWIAAFEESQETCKKKDEQLKAAEADKQKLAEELKEAQAELRKATTKRAKEDRQVDPNSPKKKGLASTKAKGFARKQLVLAVDGSGLTTVK